MSFPFPRPPIRMLWRSAADALKAPWPHEVFLPFRIPLRILLGRGIVEVGINVARNLRHGLTTRLRTTARRVLLGHAVAHHAAKVCDFGINPLPPLLCAPLRTRLGIQVRINIARRISTACRPFQRSNGEPWDGSVVHLCHHTRLPPGLGRTRSRTRWTSGLLHEGAPPRPARC